MSGAHHTPIPDDQSDVALRTKALESLLIEKGILTTDVLDAVVQSYEHDIGPRRARQYRLGHNGVFGRHLDRHAVVRS